MKRKKFDGSYFFLIETSRGYRIQGTAAHRIKVVDASGNRVWRRFAEIRAGDRVPLMLNGIVGAAQPVQLPPLGDLHWTADFSTHDPREMTAERLRTSRRSSSNSFLASLISLPSR